MQIAAGGLALLRHIQPSQRRRKQNTPKNTEFRFSFSLKTQQFEQTPLLTLLAPWRWARRRCVAV
jgi:hypothetical protein